MWKREGFQVYKGKGCEQCNDTGYKGRIAVHELLLNDDEIKRVIMRKAPSKRSARWPRRAE